MEQLTTLSVCMTNLKLHHQQKTTPGQRIQLSERKVQTKCNSFTKPKHTRYVRHKRKCKLAGLIPRSVYVHHRTNNHRCQLFASVERNQCIQMYSAQKRAHHAFQSESLGYSKYQILRSVTTVCTSLKLLCIPMWTLGNIFVEFITLYLNRKVQKSFVLNNGRPQVHKYVSCSNKVALIWQTQG